MDIKVMYNDWFFNNCDTEDQEKIIEAKINALIEVAKTNNKLLYNKSRDMFYILGDLKEFDLPEDCGEDIYTWLSECNCSDEVDIADITFYKQDCIDILKEKLNSDIELQNYIELMFNQSYIEDINFDEVLINKMIKYVMLEKINNLQQVLIKENPQIDWK